MTGQLPLESVQRPISKPPLVRTIVPVAPAGVGGLGLRMLLAPWLTLRLDARDVVYKATVRGEDDWQNQLELGLSLSVFAG